MSTALAPHSTASSNVSTEHTPCCRSSADRPPRAGMATTSTSGLPLEYRIVALPDRTCAPHGDTQVLVPHPHLADHAHVCVASRQCSEQPDITIQIYASRQNQSDTPGPLTETPCPRPKRPWLSARGLSSSTAVRSSSTLVIAEVGVNHNGDVELAHQLIEASATAGADVVKFQTFDPQLVVSASGRTADYQLQSTGQRTQQEMLAGLSLAKVRGSILPSTVGNSVSSSCRQHSIGAASRCSWRSACAASRSRPARSTT